MNNNNENKAKVAAMQATTVETQKQQSVYVQDDLVKKRVDEKVRLEKEKTEAAK